MNEWVFFIGWIVALAGGLLLGWNKDSFRRKSPEEEALLFLEELHAGRELNSRAHMEYLEHLQNVRATYPKAYSAWLRKHPNTPWD